MPDALSQILTVLRLRGSVYFHTHFSPPWGVAVPQFGNVARFHMAMRGHCWLRVAGVATPYRLETGDLAVIPHGAAHVLSDTPDGGALPVDDVIARTGYAGEGALSLGDGDTDQACKLFCGHFEFHEGAAHPVLNALPACIHVPNTETLNTAWLDSVIRFVSAEIMAGQAGSDAIVHRLSEIVFIQVIRAFVAEAGDGAGALAGVLDTKIGKSLAALHASPARAWTVEALAAEAGMSRTVFAERFSVLMGETPLRYLTDWRMRIARQDLVESNRALIEIGESIGYQSEAAFNRAFKRHYNMTPGELRRSHQA